MREYTATVRIDRQNRVTIPKAIRDTEKLEYGNVVEIVIRIKDETKISEREGNRNALALT